MTREKCRAILPVIEAFANGEHIEFYDRLQITGAFTRGAWKTADEIGFGCSVDYYRMIKDGETIYFGDRPDSTTSLVINACDNWDKEKTAKQFFSERDEKILYWAKQLEHKQLSVHELVENAKWLLDHVK